MTRRGFVSLIATAVFLFANAICAEDNFSSTKVACIGDSITFGLGIEDRDNKSYPAQLAAALGEEWSVKNFGINSATLLKKGNKPYWNMNQYKAGLKFSPDIVIIKLGTNDSKPVNWKYKAEYVPDYVELIMSFKKLKSNPTIWICYPVPAYPGRWGITDKIIKEGVIPLIDEVAKKTNVKVINLYTALSNRKELFPDTVHPNVAGAKIIAQTIARAIKGKASQEADWDRDEPHSETVSNQGLTSEKR